MQDTNLIPLDKSNEVTSFFNPKIWVQMQRMATAFKESGALPATDNMAMIMMKIQAGYEMGMKPLESVKAFYFVKGSLNIFGSAVIRRLREHGWTITYKDEPNKCTATIKKGDEEYTDSFTYEEAKRSGWANETKPAWIDGINRRLKLRYGVASLLIKTYVPEVLGSATDIAEVAMDSTMVGETNNLPTPKRFDKETKASPSQPPVEIPDIKDVKKKLVEEEK